MIETIHRREASGEEPLAPRGIETGALPRATSSQGASSPPGAGTQFIFLCLRPRTRLSGFQYGGRAPRDGEVCKFKQRVPVAGTIERTPTR